MKEKTAVLVIILALALVLLLALDIITPQKEPETIGTQPLEPTMGTATAAAQPPTMVTTGRLDCKFLVPVGKAANLQSGGGGGGGGGGVFCSSPLFEIRNGVCTPVKEVGYKLFRTWADVKAYVDLHPDYELLECREK